MENKNQKEVWNNIAEEWHEFRVKSNVKQGKHVEEFLKNKKGKILDLGSGSGNHLRNIKEGKMYLVDFSEKMISLAKEKANQENIEAEFFVSDVTNLPFEDNFFDYSIVESSLHCLNKKKQKETVKELFRVLKPKGKAEISVWNKNSKRFKNSDKEKYIGWRDKGKRYYYLSTPDEVYNLFENQGFEITSKEENPNRMIIFTVKKP
ncbi:MAG: class I SAM-dependent methyltransferase [Minisyncoccales bacterium]